MPSLIERHAYQLAHYLFWEPDEYQIAVITKAMAYMLKDYEETEAENLEPPRLRKPT
jgi:hypothetical protein